MPYDARAVANAILDISDEQHVELTHMAVHKLIFYSHGWYLLESGQPLVNQPFEAWEHGPVLRCVWQSLKVARDTPVADRRAAKHDLIHDRWFVVRPDVSPEDRVFLGRVVAAYGYLHAYELSRMTHAKGGPWDRVYNAPSGTVNLGMRITDDAIRDHFHHVTTTGPLPI